MKNNLKFLLYASFIYLAGTGCNKTDTVPQVPPPVFTVQSDSYKAGVTGVYQPGFVGGLASPQLSFRNVPKDTKQFIAVLEDDANHLYWSAAISGTVRDLEAVHGGTAPMYHHLDIMTPIKYYRVPDTFNGATACTLSIFALNAMLTEDEWVKIRHPEQRINREEFVKMLSITNNNRILGLTKTVYPIQIPQATIKLPQSTKSN